MSNDKFYKIKDDVTGLYSRGGGGRPRFSKTGKVWRGSGPLRLHLRNVDPNWYIACDVIEIQVVEVNVLPIEDFFNLNTKADKEREETSIIRQQKYERERDLKELERLRIKYGN